MLLILGARAFEKLTGLRTSRGGRKKKLEALSSSIVSGMPRKPRRPMTNFLRRPTEEDTL